jgi:steroid 5-alpha reductase family enzyme
MAGLILSLAVFLAAAMTLAWGIQRRLGNAGWVDVVWSFATGLAGVGAALAPLSGAPFFASVGARQWLVAALAAAWSLRLGLHLARRVARGPEDARYAGFRRDWGAGYEVRMFWFLQIQAAAALLLALVMLAAARRPAAGLDAGDLLAVLVLAVAVAGEGLADQQLHRFKADPANHGRICDRGLWAWSRHPNYFFEWLVWLAYPLIAIRPDSGYAWGWAALAGPVFMYWLLVHVSGVPPLEAQMRRSRGAAFDAYAARTSAFFPRPPRPAPLPAGTP